MTRAAPATGEVPASRPAASAYAPLRRPLFFWLWVAFLVSYVGTWVQNVAAAWLMTGLDASALMVALAQAAANVPFFLIVLPAGALADIVDRRRLLLFGQVWMLLAAAGAAGYLGQRPVSGSMPPTGEQQGAEAVAPAAESAVHGVITVAACDTLQKRLVHAG